VNRAMVDVEFVVVEEDVQPTTLATRPAPPVRWHIDDDGGLTNERARRLLAELLRVPFAVVRVVGQVGRVALLEYEPLGTPDPDIVICDFPSAKPINRVLCDLQRARGVAWRDWQEFWGGIDWYAEELKRLTAGAAMTAEERAYLLAWVYHVRDSGKTIERANPEWSRYY